MENKIKNAIEKYQCTGCVNGSDISCYEERQGSLSCKSHLSGTIMTPAGKILLGLPKGFCRLGPYGSLIPNIWSDFNTSDWNYDKWNIPVWKHLTKDGHTLVRGISPRTNVPFIHIYLEDCMSKIDCLEISKKEIDLMD